MPLMEKKDKSLQQVGVEEAARMVKDKEAVRFGAKPKKTKKVDEAPADKKMKSPAKKK